MNQPNAPNIFHCPSCEQVLQSTLEQIGMEICCPNCESEFTVPNNLQIGNREEIHQVPPSEITDNPIKEIYSFTCPACHQNYTIEENFADCQIECSNCGTAFHIPKTPDSDEKGQFSSNENVNREENFLAEERANEPRNLLESFDNDDLNLIQDAMEIPLESLQNLTVEIYWEYTIIAELLKKQLAPLAEVLNHSASGRSAKKTWGRKRSRFKKFIKNYFDEMFKLLFSLYNLMSKDFNDALCCGDIHSIFIFSEKMNLLTNDLVNLHQKIFEESIPNDDHYIQLHELVTSWVSYCGKRLVELVDVLMEKGNRSREYQGIHPQVSFVPPNLYKFALTAKELGIGFDPRQEIFSNFS